MADKQTARLCYHVLLSHFGPIVAKVSFALLQQGRLSLPNLVRLSGVPTPQTRHALLVLIQHNIVWHSQTEVDPESGGPAEGQIMYEMNWEEAVARARFGKYLTIVEDKVGEAAAEVVRVVLDHGKLRPAQIIELLAFGDAQRSRLFSAAILALVSQKYLKPSTVASHHSPRDRLIAFEAECRRERGNATIMTPKILMEIKMTAGTRLQREEEEADETALIEKDVIGDSKPGKKRALEKESVVNEEVYFKVNYPKLNTCIRNEIIVRAAQCRFNEQTAEVIRAALKATEAKQHDLLDVRSDPMTSHQISPHISPSIDLSTGIVLPRRRSASSSAKNGHSAPAQPKVRDYIQILTNAEDEDSPTGRASAFMAKVTGGGGGEGRVTVEFEVIGKRLKLKTFEDAIKDRFGHDAIKVVRILLQMGKLDEKHLAKISLMTQLSLRSLLTKLSVASFVSLQEVPRGADRANPKSMFYLWYVDLPKAYSNLLSHLYQTLANIVARSEHEQEQVRAILDKRDRSDVNGDERLLSRGEREALREWEDKRDRLGILAARVEDMVFILRDMIG